MKYFLDTEFLEGPQKEKFPISLFRKQTPNTIDLISIGIIAEDGREYYSISKDFNMEEAWNRFDMKEQKGSYVWLNGIVDGEVVWFPNEDGKDKLLVKQYWIRENVLKPIWIDLFLRYESEHTFLKGKSYDYFEEELKRGLHDNLFTFKSFKALVNRYGKSKKQISADILKFTIDVEVIHPINDYKKTYIEIYAYYADYDWVVFCWLFGKMLDLPKGFPMFCRDLKQMLVEIPVKYKTYVSKINDQYIVGADPYYVKWEQHVDYPKQENEHDALADARWNKKLFDFIQKIKEIN
jgi:hypothetical protein